MRVALVQAVLDPKSPSRNIQGLSAIVREAAGTRPAPDLIVLPGKCDTGGTSIKPASHRATVRGVREAISFEARYWGVYIAAGLHRLRGDGWIAASALFDPDGDVVTWAHGGPVSGESRPTASVALWDTALGRIGVADAGGLNGGDDPESFLAGGELVAVPLAPAGTGRGKKAETEWRPGGGTSMSKAHWCTVVPAEPDGKGGATCLVAPDGTILCEAGDGQRRILFAEVELPSACEARSHASAQDGGT